MSLSAIYSAIELISNTLAQIPIEVKRRDEANKITTLKEHSIKFALRNSQLTHYMLIKCAVSDMLRHGNGFIYLNRAKDGTVIELQYVPAPDVVIYYNKKTRKVYYSVQNIGKVEPKDIMHLYMRSDDGINGISVLKYATRAVELSNYVENTALDFYAKGGMTTGLLKSKVPMLGKQATDAMALVSGEVNTTKSNNLIKFLPFDLDYITLSTTPLDSQLIESRKFNIAEVARYLCVPLSLLQGDKISNIENVNIQFLV
jgi:HK97 family phage portal protein